MGTQSTNFESPIQQREFIATTPELSLNNFEDKLYIAESPEKNYGLKIPITLDPGGLCMR